VTPCVTPIPLLTLQGAVSLFADRVEIGGKRVDDAVREVVSRGQEFEHCGGEQRMCGDWLLVLSAKPS
jgi:hypothetical protein